MKSCPKSKSSYKYFVTSAVLLHSHYLNMCFKELEDFVLDYKKMDKGATEFRH